MNQLHKTIESIDEKKKQKKKENENTIYDVDITTKMMYGTVQISAKDKDEAMYIAEQMVEDGDLPFYELNTEYDITENKDKFV